jgi:uncharacterized membrane protein YgcG
VRSASSAQLLLIAQDLLPHVAASINAHDLAVLATCSGDDCDDVRKTFGAASTEYQQCKRSSGSGYRGSGGGSYGGYSSGGGHK